MTDNANAMMNPMTTQHTAGVEQSADRNGAKKKMSPEEVLDWFAKGKIRLLKPIRGSNKDIEELRWDFRNLNGWEYAKAMECANSADAMKITAEQALCLFAVSAAKETTVKNESGEDIHPLNEFDIRTRIGADDAASVAWYAWNFFRTSVLVAEKRISRE